MRIPAFIVSLIVLLLFFGWLVVCFVCLLRFVGLLVCLFVGLFVCCCHCYIALYVFAFLNHFARHRRIVDEWISCELRRDSDRVTRALDVVNLWIINEPARHERAHAAGHA